MTEIEHDSGRRAPTTTAHLMYLMHAISPFTMWTLSLLAIVVGALTRDSVRGTWVESHYQYMLSTCLKGIGWAIVLTIVFFLTIVGIFFLVPLWFILTVWFLYRVIKGWIRLNDGQPAPF